MRKVNVITARRAAIVTIQFIALSAIIVFCVTGCVTATPHEFSEPSANWTIKTGQLMYRTPQTTLTGDVLVRYSSSGDFQLTLSKGPGLVLLSLRQDASFADVTGEFTHSGWSGRVDHAPPQLRGWLSLRDKLIHSPSQQTVRYSIGNETFLFRF